MGASTTSAHARAHGQTARPRLPYALVKPATQTAPVIYASPHSGRFYPRDFVESSQLNPTALRRSEDAFVDDIYESCTQHGSPLLKALYPRAYIDVNREPYELDPNMFDSPLPSFVNTESPRALAGLGTVAKIVTSGAEIYAKKLNFDQVDTRIREVYHPYHHALRTLIENTRHNFSSCVLIDCHSMPSNTPGADGQPQVLNTDIILGDRFGTSCKSSLTENAQEILEDIGFRVRRNRPYAGGFTTQHYGDPNDRVHVLQIELNRALYMDETQVKPGADFDEIKMRLSEFIQRLNQVANSLL